MTDLKNMSVEGLRERVVDASPVNNELLDRAVRAFDEMARCLREQEQLNKTYCSRELHELMEAVRLWDADPCRYHEHLSTQYRKFINTKLSEVLSNPMQTDAIYPGDARLSAFTKAEERRILAVMQACEGISTLTLESIAPNWLDVVKQTEERAEQAESALLACQAREGELRGHIQRFDTKEITYSFDGRSKAKKIIEEALSHSTGSKIMKKNIEVRGGQGGNFELTAITGLNEPLITVRCRKCGITYKTIMNDPGGAGGYGGCRHEIMDIISDDEIPGSGGSGGL